jgi:sucrose phosphorylase
MIGLPGIYFHSLVGSRGWREGVLETGRNRTINRKKFDRLDLETRLLDSDSRESEVFNRLKHLLRVRSSNAAFHPHGNQQILDINPGVFGLWRSSPNDEDGILCLHNVSGRVQGLDLTSIIELDRLSEQPGDTISGKMIKLDQPLAIQPYQTLWIK